MVIAKFINVFLNLLCSCYSKTLHEGSTMQYTSSSNIVKD